MCLHSADGGTNAFATARGDTTAMQHFVKLHWAVVVSVAIVPILAA